MTFKFGITDFSCEVKERVTGSEIKYPESIGLSVRQCNEPNHYVITGGIFQTYLKVTDAENGAVDCWEVVNSFTIIDEKQCTVIAKCDNSNKPDLTFLFDYKLRKDGKWFTYADLSFVKILD